MQFEIREWFLEHKHVIITCKELMQVFGCTRSATGRALQILHKDEFLDRKLCNNHREYIYWVKENDK